MLGIACDMFVPPLENYYESPKSAQGVVNRAKALGEKGKLEENHRWDVPRWYTTVNITIDVKRALPEQGVKWLFTRMQMSEVNDGRCDVHGRIWDEHGNIIALAQYLWFVADVSQSSRGKAIEKESATRGSKI